MTWNGKRCACNVWSATWRSCRAPKPARSRSAARTWTRATLIRAVAGRLRPQFDDKEVALALDLPAQLPSVYADPARITQVLLNLLGNALQYTPSGGAVSVSARDDTRQLLVAVQDNGVGISGADLPHVFERFYRVDKSRSRAGGGSGVGLTISQHIVEAHGGHITAASPGAGTGSTFTFTLPHTS